MDTEMWTTLTQGVSEQLIKATKQVVATVEFGWLRAEYLTDGPIQGEAIARVNGVPYDLTYYYSAEKKMHLTAVQEIKT